MWRTQIEDKHEGWMQLEHWILGYLWSTAYSECHTEIVHGFCKYQSFIQYNHDHTKWVQNGLCHRLSILIQFYSYLLILGLRAQLPRNGLHLMPHLLFASFHFLPNLHCGQQPDNNIYIVSKLLMCWIYIDIDMHVLNITHYSNQINCGFKYMYTIHVMSEFYFNIRIPC